MTRRWLAALSLAGATTPVAAQPAGAQADACDAFEGSLKVEAATPTLLDLAACRENNGQLATAWGLFLDAERQTRSATDDVGRQLHQVAVYQARKLEPKLSRLTIHVPDAARPAITDIQRDGAPIDPVVWNIALPIDGGTYHVVVHERDAPELSVAVTIGNEGDAKTVDVPEPQRARPAEPAPPPTATPVVSNAPEIWYCTRSAVANLGTCKPTRAACDAFRDAASAYLHDLTDCGEERAASRSSPEHASRPDLPFSVTVVGGALLAGTTIFAVSAVSAYDEAKAEMYSESRRRSLYDSANRKLLTAQVLGVAGLGCVAAGVWLYLRHHDEPSSPRAALAITPSGAFVMGSF